MPIRDLSFASPASAAIPVLLVSLSLPMFIRQVAVSQQPATGSQKEASDQARAERLARLIRQTHSDDEETRLKAISLIGEMGPAARPAIPVLIELLDSDRGQRSYVRHALVKIGKDILPAVTKALTHKSANVRIGAAMTLEDMGKDARPTIPNLLALLDDADLEVRTNTCGALGSIGGDGVVDRLLRVMKADKEITVRGVAAHSAARLTKDRPEARPVIVAVIESMKDKRLILEDARAAFSSAGKYAVPEMLTLIEDPKTSAAHREVAFQVLFHAKKKNIGRANLQRLVKLIDNPVADIRQMSILILEWKAIGNADAVRRVEQALKDKSPLVRVQAAECFFMMTGRINPPIDVLIKEMTSMDAEVREAACMSVAEFGPAGVSAVPALIVRLKDGAFDVRFQAIRALGEIGPGAKAAEGELKKIAGGIDPDLRGLAEDALRQIRQQR